MQGGTISSGFACTLSVSGAYWMSWISVVLEHDRTRRHRQIAANLEGARRRHRNVSLLQIAQQVLHALADAFTLGIAGLSG
jgi:hypothetical protein